MTNQDLIKAHKLAQNFFYTEKNFLKAKLYAKEGLEEGEKYGINGEAEYYAYFELNFMLSNILFLESGNKFTSKNAEGIFDYAKNAVNAYETIPHNSAFQGERADVPLNLYLLVIEAGLFINNDLAENMGQNENLQKRLNYIIEAKKYFERGKTILPNIQNKEYLKKQYADNEILLYAAEGELRQRIKSNSNTSETNYISKIISTIVGILIIVFLLSRFFPSSQNNSNDSTESYSYPKEACFKFENSDVFETIKVQFNGNTFQGTLDGYAKNANDAWIGEFRGRMEGKRMIGKAKETYDYGESTYEIEGTYKDRGITWIIEGNRRIYRVLDCSKIKY